ncbi:MAG: DUF3108 domain-containing protein [Pseudomonadota bacterium]
MVQIRKSQAGVVLILLLCVNIAQAMPFDNESLAFHAYYQGPFSGQKQIGIADVHWQTLQVNMNGSGKTAIETRMEVSSEAYDFVEKLYPFRLLYRSLVSLQPMVSIAYERYDSTDKHGRELTWLDAESSLVLRFREGYEAGRETDSQLPGVIASWGSQQQDYQFYKPARHKVLPQMVDELALLQRIRGEELSVGAQFEIPVTDGKRQYLYKVLVMGSEPLTMENKSWDALKIKFNGYRIKHGENTQAHDTVWVWLANTPQRTPLRFEHRDAIGRFVIDLLAIDNNG